MKVNRIISILFLMIYGFFSMASAQDIGLTYMHAQNYQKAKIHYAATLESTPNDPGANHYLGRSFYALGDLENGIKYLERASELEETNPEYQYWAGRVYVEKIKTASLFEKMRYASKVKAHFSKAVELDPKNVKARRGLTYFYIRAPGIAGGSISEAKRHAEIVIQLDATVGHELMAEVYVEDGENTLAEKELMKLLAFESAKEQVHYKIGYMYQEQKAFHKAFESFDIAISINPTYGPALYQYGKTGVLTEQNVDLSISYMKKYLTLEVLHDEPDHSSANWRLGMLYELKGDKSLARDVYAEALRLDPKNKHAQDALDDL